LRPSSLNRGCIFCWSGYTAGNFTGTPVKTGVSKVALGQHRAWSFAGGAEAASDMNFGALATTADLHEQPATWAFVASAPDLTQCALACQTDANVAKGWSVGYHRGTSNFGLGVCFIRSTTNLRKTITELPTGTFVFSVSYAGGNAASGVSLYLNGRPATTYETQDGVGTSTPATAESLYLGRRRYDTALSHSGKIALAFIANRIWSDAEHRAFAANPFRVFASKPGIF
jgi:hypothetical protein